MVPRRRPKGANGQIRMSVAGQGACRSRLRDSVDRGYQTVILLRCEQVSLTKQSLALAARMAPQIEGVYDDIENRVGKLRIDAIDAMLDELMAALDPSPH